MHELGVEPTATIAEALCRAHHRHRPLHLREHRVRAHVIAAELIEAGVDVHEVYRRVYEDVP